MYNPKHYMYVICSTIGSRASGIFRQVSHVATRELELGAGLRDQEFGTGKPRALKPLNPLGFRV